jgi:hypothetical protein
MIQKLIFLLLLIPIGTYAQVSELEQKTFDFFFDSIFREKYPNIDELKFTGCTEKELTEFGLFTDCFKRESPAVWELLYDHAHGKTLPPAKIDVSRASRIVKMSKHAGKSKIRLHVLRAIRTKDKSYVMIGLVKHRQFTHAYFFELDNTGNILGWCETGLTH